MKPSQVPIVFKTRASLRRHYDRFCRETRITPLERILLSFSRRLFFAALTVFLPASVAAPNETIVFGADWHFPPHQYLNEEGHPDGFDVDIFRAIAKAKNLETEFHLDDWRKIQDKLKTGDIDVAPMFKSEERARRFLFTDSIMSGYYLLFARTGSDTFRDIDGIHNETLAVQRGGYAWKVIEPYRHRLNILETETESEALWLVAEDKADLALASVQLGSYIIATRNYKNIVSVSPPLFSAEYAFAVSPRKPELVDLINDGLTEIRANGTYDQIYGKWVSNLDAIYKAYQSGLFHSLWIILPLLAVALILLFWLVRFYTQLSRTKTLSADLQHRALEAEKKVEESSRFDTLTNLPKKYLFEGHLKDVLNALDVHRHKLAVASVGITDLDKVQQIAGYQTADKLTRGVAQILFKNVSESVFISHFGHGRFGLIMKDIANERDAVSKLHKIIGQAEVQTVINEFPINVSLSSGLSLYPDHALEAQELYRAAELACDLSRIKRNSLLVYEPNMEPDPRNLVLISDLREAIKNEQLHWAFQPKYSLKNKAVIGAEMLVRWDHPRYGSIPPNLFIPLAEESGIIHDLTQLLIRRAGFFCKQWQDQGYALELSINVSGNDLSDSALITWIQQSFIGMTDRLTLEVTETAIMEDIEGILQTIKKLRQLGVKIALDDYGTGYSSLVYLKRIQPDELKIDQVFIKSLPDSPEDEKIVRASIELGHELGALITAEGVESKEVLTKLEKLHCDAVQGFAIEKPMAVHEFMHFWHSGGLSRRES